MKTTKTKEVRKETKEAKRLCKCTWCCRSRAEEETLGVIKVALRGPGGGYRGGVILERRSDTPTSHSKEIKKLYRWWPSRCTWCCQSRAEKQTNGVNKAAGRGPSGAVTQGKRI